MEILLACALLCRLGFAQRGEYEEHLHEMFLARPDDPLLLELEWRSSSLPESTALLERYGAERGNAFSVNAFGACVLDRLRRAYCTENTDLRAFSRSIYALWALLPGYLRNREPFGELCWIEDLLRIHGEEAMRDSCERLFAYYENKS